MSRDISELLKPARELSPPSIPPAYQEGLDVGDMVSFLLNFKWLILLFLMGGGLIGWFNAFTETPIYIVDTTVQVEEQSNGFPALEGLTDVLATSTSSSTEIELIGSRTNLGRAVDGLGLRVHVNPHFAPYIGAAIARRFTHKEFSIAPSPEIQLEKLNKWLPESWIEKLNPVQYAWGGEQIQVKRFSVQGDKEVRNWKIKKLEDNTYSLSDELGNLILDGQVGKTSQANDPAHGNVSIFISKLAARPGTLFNLSKTSQLSAIESLTRKLNIKEKGKKTGVIELSMRHTDKDKAKSILNLIANNYMRLNVEQKSQEAQQMLSFIEKQLPALKTDLTAAETVLEDHKRSHGAVDLPLETQSIIDNSADLEKQISLLKLERSELSRKFTDKHPRLIALNEKVSHLRARNSGLTKKLKAIPETEWESAKLARDVQVANELYLMLLNKGQELKIARAGTVGNVRIVDPAAQQTSSINEASSLVVSKGLLLGLIIGIGVSLLLKNLKKGLIDPSEIETKTGVPVYAEILESKVQRSIKIGKWRSRRSSNQKLLSRLNPKDPAVEALRSLRTYLQFAQLDSENNIVTISGPSSGVGKSFVAANLSAILADSGKKVLLIDADLRKGYLHAYFNSERSPGLSDLISRKAKLKEAVRVYSKNLHYIPTGTVPPNPSEVLMSRRFEKILRSASKTYDLILVDTPPVLAVTDPLIVANQAGSTFLVLKAGYHHEKEINEAIKRFDQAGIKVSGLILNQLPKIKYKRYSYGSKGKEYYQYSYE